VKAAFLAAGFNIARIESLKIPEDDARWPAIQKLIRAFRLVDIPMTEFLDTELKAAKYLHMVGTWHNGYPEPSDDFTYKEITFDPSAGCRQCGVGLKQIAPFRLKRAPKWGRRSAFQLYWVFDEVFVRPEVWDATFAPLGIGCSPVVLDRTGEVIQNVVQLNIKEVSDVDVEKLEFETCSECGSKKFSPKLPGFQPAPLSPIGPIFKSDQYFGSGGQAFRLVMLANDAYRKISARGFHGFEFLACSSGNAV